MRGHPVKSGTFSDSNGRRCDGCGRVETELFGHSCVVGVDDPPIQTRPVHSQKYSPTCSRHASENANHTMPTVLGGRMISNTAFPIKGPVD